MRYDIAIIGTGPGGVSAAITAKIRNKSIILFGSSELSPKIRSASKILNYPGLPEISGAELCDRFKAQLCGLGIEITEKQVGAVYAMGSYFGIQAGTDMYEATSCILACGVSMKEAIPGEEQFTGRGVSYCATCDGQFYKGKTVAVIGYNEEAESDAVYLSELCKMVYYIPVKRVSELNELAKHENISIINAVPKAIEGSLKAERLITSEGSCEPDGIFVIRDAIAPDKLVPGLRTDGGHVIADKDMATNLKGLFACGDITGTPYQYIRAAGQGNVAALSAVKYLAEGEQPV